MMSRNSEEFEDEVAKKKTEAKSRIISSDEVSINLFAWIIENKMTR